MSEINYTEVFVPGGFPRHTYNPRLGLKLEAAVKQVTENFCKLVPVTGHTKAGKTVLVRSILPRKMAVWVDGGGVKDEDDFWTTIIEQLDLFQSTESSNDREIAAGTSATGTASANFIVAKGEAGLTGTLETTRRSGTTQGRTVSSRVAALAGLRLAVRPLVVDDFHYLPKELQGELVRALKPLVFDGLPVVIIAIPHRRYDALKVEKEMTGRIHPVEIPAWSEEELKFIPSQGFPLLNGSLSEQLAQRLASESIGSPHLMQEFCRSICKLQGVSTTFCGRNVDISESDLLAVFTETANTIGRPIFEKLARGPRQRSDRMQRQLKTGKGVDIYGLVLHALAILKPGLTTLEYEDIRSAIREIAADALPQMHEIARVLKHMSEIAATDQSSTPVIEFDEADKRLHITDPFFAFYLRWGNLERE